MKRIITHNGPFHADDCMAVAVLELLLEKEGESYEVVRTRDAAIWPTGDFVVDVGGVHDPKTCRYDHHQEGGAGGRENGVPYSSIGLVWKYHGRDLVSEERVWDRIDKKLVQPMDLVDVGIEVEKSALPYGVGQYTLDDMVHAFYPPEQDLARFDERFSEIVRIFKTLISYEIAECEKKVREADMVREYYERAEDKRIVVFDRYSSGKSVLSEFPEPLFVVYPNVEGNAWKLSTVRVDAERFAARKLFPAEWAAKRGADLAKASGVPDADFCHNGRWIAAARSKEGAIAMARKALEA